MSTFYFCAVPPNTPIRPRGLERVADGGALLRRRGRARQAPACCAAIPAIPVRARGASRRSRSRSARRRRRAVAEVEAGRADYVASVPHGRPGSADRALRARQPRRGRRAASGTSRHRHRPSMPWCSTRAGRCSPGPRCGGRSTTRSTAARWRASRSPGRRGPADRPAHTAGLARVPRRHDLPARRARPRHGPAPGGRRPAARRPVHVQRTRLRRAGRDRAREPRGDRDRARDPAVQLSPRCTGGSRTPTSRSTCRSAAGSARSRTRRSSSTPCSSYAASTGFLDRTPLGQRMRAASRLAGAARIEAYAALDRDIASQAAPFAPYLQRRAHGLLLRTHRMPGRASALRHRPRGALRPGLGLTRSRPALRRAAQAPRLRAHHVDPPEPPNTIATLAPSP